MTRTPPQPTGLLFFGPNCAGKSVVAQALAELLPHCAHIEVDTLVYMVRGGLVAWSRGASPLEQPAEYARQCELAERNAVALCRGFAEAGFSSVVEGLGDHCRPDTDWIEANLGWLPVRTVALVCEEQVLRARWQERGWSKALVRVALDQLVWYREHARHFDTLLDTSQPDPAAAAKHLRDALSV